MVMERTYENKDFIYQFLSQEERAMALNLSLFYQAAFPRSRSQIEQNDKGTQAVSKLLKVEILFI